MNEVEQIVPYHAAGDNRSKGEQVRQMFDAIAPAYDVMNRLMTLGIDKLWRRRCVKISHKVNPHRILDLAAGTGDLTVALAQANPQATVNAVDISASMLARCRKKAEEKGLTAVIDVQVADALALPFADATFDLITIAFGVRNFENISGGYREMYRVLRPGGKLVVLELAVPENKIVRPFYKFYTGSVIPRVGKMIARDKSAYSYLPESIAAVPARNDMAKLLTDTGFRNVKWHNCTMGVALIYEAEK